MVVVELSVEGKDTLTVQYLRYAPVLYEFEFRASLGAGERKLCCQISQQYAQVFLGLQGKLR